MQKALPFWILCLERVLHQNGVYVMRHARIQISKSKRSFKLWNSSCSFSDHTRHFPPSFFRKFGSISVYLSLPSVPTSNFELEFLSYLAEEWQSLLQFWENTAQWRWGNQILFPVKKYSSLNSTVTYSVGLALAKHYMHTLDSVTGQTIFYLASGWLGKDLIDCKCRWRFKEQGGEINCWFCGWRK